MADDLFAAAAATALERQSPLADRLRPTRLDDVVGQEHLLGRGKPLRSLIEADRLSSVIFWGFVFWLLDTLATSRFKSKQGCYDRADSPVRYWIHIALLIVFNLAMGYGWVHYILIATS